MTSSQTHPLNYNQRFQGYLPVVIDIETGGVNPQTDAILEIAAVFLGLDKHGVLTPIDTDTYHVLPFEGAKLHEEAMKSHKQFKKYLGKDPLNKILQSQIKKSKELKIVNVEKGSD